MMNPGGDVSLLSRIIFRRVLPTDVSQCYQIESASYPEDEAASKAKLQYRQHHAAPFFRCAFLVSDDGDNTSDGRTCASTSISYQGQSMHPSATLRGTIIGFVCATLCDSFTAEAMKVHDAAGKILAIHSVVVDEKYRNHGVASAMLQDYILAMENLNEKGKLKTKMEKIVLIAKKEKLAFYVRNGFTVTGVSPVAHGKEQWFDLERTFASANKSNANSYECYLVDSFADVDKRGSGNPAGVVILNDPPGVSSESHGGDCRDGSLEEDLNEDEDENADGEISVRGVQWMSTVAKEFNQSETAFIWPLRHDQSSCQLQDDASTPTYVIRYYTRTGVEVDLCGHATLAAACCVFHRENSKQYQKIAFVAKNDTLQAELHHPADIASNSTNASRIVMSFPWKNVTPVLPEKDIEEILSMMSRAFFGMESIQSTAFFTQHVIHFGTTDGMEDLFIELTEAGFDSLLGVQVGHGALTSWEGYSRGVIICCCSSGRPSSVDFRSRFFGPKVGIDEDPVTGSAHCSLGPYFGKKLGKSVVVGRQESERGGLVECILRQEEGRVCIVGTGVMVLSGQLSIRM
ncbi:hypothetical protein ACHAXH_003647 [Discostella pseudostelligera]